MLVVWDDASSLDAGWYDPDEVPKNQLVTTVGFLVAESEEHVVLAQSTDDVWVNGRFQIPKKMIREMKPLKVVTQKRS